MRQQEESQLEQETGGGDDCLLCDRVLALVGLGAGLIITAMAVDLLTGGAISMRLFGSRRDPSAWDTTEGGQDGPPAEPGPAAESPAAASEGGTAAEVGPDA